MRTWHRAWVIGGALAATGLLAPAAAFGQWGGSSASGDFTYANGGDMNGLFGAPQSAGGPSGNTLFFNLNFNALAGGPAQSDTMTVDVHAAPGLFFGLIRFSFDGAYLAGFNSSVNATASLGLTEIGGLGRSWTEADPEVDPFASTPTFPVAGFDPGPSWGGLVVADLQNLAMPATDLTIDLSHLVEVIGASGSISTQQGGLRLEALLIPEPASLALMALGGVAMLRRRRQ